MKQLHWFFKIILATLFIFLFWILISVVLPGILPIKKVSGEVRGLIFQDQLWNGEIFITGDLVTLPNVNVGLESGTRVYISKKSDKNNFDILPWHLSNGVNTGPEYRGILAGEPFWDEKEKVFVYFSHLKTLGNGDPVMITSLGENKSPYDINLIKIEDGELSGVHFSNYRRLEIGPNVKIADSTFDNTGECAVCVSSGSPLIKGNTFKNGKRDFINISDATPLIIENEFLESRGDGLLIQSGSDNFIRIFDNLFQMPSKKSIKINSVNQKGDISGNFFLLGDIELPCNNRVRLINNQIRASLIFKNIGGCTGEYTVFENYWEIMDAQNILNARISGASDQFKVKIPRILKSPPK